MKTYRAALIGCSRMGAFIDNEVWDYPAIVLPYSHAAGYVECSRTEFVACSDLRVEVMKEVGKRYGVPEDRHYTDYRELIEKEQPDIVSVATQPEQRAEVVIFAVEHGVKAIYAEKAMAASMQEAEAMVNALEANGAILNLGTNRRWGPGFDKMKEVIDSGELGALRSLIIYSNGTLFNASSHSFDLILRLNSDCPATSVQSSLRAGDDIFEGDILRNDPVAEGIIQFENGVTVYALLTPREGEWEAICEHGTVTALNNGMDWQLRRQVSIGETRWKKFEEDRFPSFEPASSTLRIIEDLVHSLNTGEPPRGGVRAAYASTELIFAFIDSHRRGGSVVELPLKGSTIRLERKVEPRQPRY